MVGRRTKDEGRKDEPVRDEWLATWENYPPDLISGDDSFLELSCMGRCQDCGGEYGDGWSNCTCEPWEHEDREDG